MKENYDTYIRIRISEGMREKLDKDRGSLSMSEYIRGLIGGEVVITKEKKDVITSKDVITKNEEVVITDLESLKREIKDAMERGDRENWARVKELVNQAGYSWDYQTKVLSKDGREVWRGYINNL